MKPGSDYPNSQGYYTLKTAEGHEYGEWRVGGGDKGAQTVIFGRHPHDMDYQILIDKPPIEIEFAQLKWFGPAPGQPEAAQQNLAPPPVGDLSRRILAYLDGCPGAVSGKGGHIQTLKVATQLVIGFDLGIDGARPWLREYNKKCEPPWLEKELEHKLEEAAKNKLGREAGAKIHGEPSHESSYGGFGVFCGGSVGSDPGIFVDWEKTVTNTPNHPRGDTQEAPFPADSILADYYEYAVTQSEGADSYIIGSILPIVAALLGRNVWVPWG